MIGTDHGTQRIGTESQATMSASATFRPFDPDGPLCVYVRNLPHWRQEGAMYFVTFRQSDSIPKAVLAEWFDTRQRWYNAHHINLDWRESDPERFTAAFRKIAAEVRRPFEREQARLLHEELDRSHGSCVLRHALPRHEVIQSLMHFHGERCWLGDFVVMPNHIHALVQPFDGWELEELLGSIKRWTSRLIGKWLAAQSKSLQPEPMHARERFWQPEFYDRIVRDGAELHRYRRYIADNASKAGLPAGQYEYQAADWLDSFSPRPHPSLGTLSRGNRYASSTWDEGSSRDGVPSCG